ncbi:MAG: DUF3598 family protein [Spirulinaceae cyanobacterium]
MSLQWKYLLKNLGEWQGSFTRLSPNGEELEDTPTIVTLEGLNDNKTIHQVVRRLPPHQPPNHLVLEYSSLGNSILFFENGAFCQGSMQWSPYSQFGAELGLIFGERRLRLVQLFEGSGDSKLTSLTLIREKLAGSQTPERPPLSLEHLLGEWQGEAITIYPDRRKPDTFQTHLAIQHEGNSRIKQKLTFGTRTIESSAQITDSKLTFDQSEMQMQVLFLPDGCSSNCPVNIKPRLPFVLELGWLIEPRLRQRIIRSYSPKGEWLSVTFVEERKLGNG